MWPINRLLGRQCDSCPSFRMCSDHQKKVCPGPIAPPPPRRTRLELETLEDRTVPANAIVTENQLLGNPASEWDITGAGDSTLQGFATDISVNQGQTVQFKIKDSALAPYRLDIYRMGYYGGMGARKVATIPSSATLRQTQPNPLTNAATGLVDCGNWAVSASWAVPANATSGIYFAKAIRDDTGGASHIFFVVRDDDGNSDLLFQTSDSTWQAYNNFGGKSLYDVNSTNEARAYKVSYNRPITTRATSGGMGNSNFVFWGEYPMVRWLEANGFNVSYFTNVDSARRGTEIQEHQVFLSVGHDEYWSGDMRANVEAARDAGVHLAFFSGNEMYWKTRWESSIDSSGTPFRTLVCYKESVDDGADDPTNTWTGLWRDMRRIPPGDTVEPEQLLTGQIFSVNRGPGAEFGTAIKVPEAEGKMRLWRNTSVATLSPGQTATLANGTLGYEWDEDVDNGYRPAGTIHMSSTTENVPEKLVDPVSWPGCDGSAGHPCSACRGCMVAPGTATHTLTQYKAPSGALVFGAGTVQWSWGLDGNHDGGSTTPDVRMRQATVNLFADMGVQPESLQSGLVAATASTDAVAPTSTITSPTGGTVVQVGQAVTISGTAADTGGGRVGGVEVSTDDGLTWHPAVGRTSWSYVWTPISSGPAVLRSRAADDSGNLGVMSAGRSVTVSSSNTLVAAYSFDAGSGATLADASGKGNSGTISGATWTASGKYGKALTFDGVNDWVTVNDSSTLDLSSTMTIEAWVFPTAINGWESVILKEANGDLAYGLYSDNNGNDSGGPRRPIVSVRQGGNTYWTPGAAQVALNNWSHLAATFDGSNLKMYVNGTLASTLSAPGSISVSANPLRMGGNSVWGEWFDGRIDEVRIYNRVLLQSEIQNDMNTPIGVADTQPPTAPTNLTANGGIGSVGLSWTASTDNVSVANYNVHRSTTSNFTPTAGNRIAQPTSTSYTDTGMPAGTYYYRVTAQDSANNVSGSSNEATGTSTTDSTPPTVNVTAPSGGATVSGTITVSANASDNVGVVGVQFLLDGANLGAEDTTAPYSISWNSNTVANGTHTLAARARDAAGNQTTSTTVTITVNNQVSSGLVAAYGFNEASGSTVSDASGSGNTGTISGATRTASGKYGRALSFDGINDLVTISDSASLDLTTALTLEAWVRPVVAVSGRTVILKEAGTEEVYAIYGNEDLPRPLGAVRIGGAYKIATGTSQLPLNTWSHLASTYDGATLRLYVNGTQVGSVPTTGSIEVSSGVVRIGGNSIWGEYFSGLIDEVRIYNRALSVTEIQTDMNTPVGSPERLLGEPMSGNASPLSQHEIRALFDEAVTRWSAVLGDPFAAQRLQSVRVEIMDLPGTTLGLADGAVIYLDADGAGHGWFLDSTPWEDSEFAPGLAESPAVGRVDLLTVMAHEMGHILGLADDPATDPFMGTVMADVLPLGIRRIHLENLVSAVAPSSPPPIVSDTAPRFAVAAARSQTSAAPARLPARIASSPGVTVEPASDNPSWFLAPTLAAENSTAGDEEQKRKDPSTINALEPTYGRVFDIIHAKQGIDDVMSSLAFAIPDVVVCTVLSVDGAKKGAVSS
jgi:hypothetical protein